TGLEEPKVTGSSCRARLEREPRGRCTCSGRGGSSMQTLFRGRSTANRNRASAGADPCPGAPSDAKPGCAGQSATRASPAPGSSVLGISVVHEDVSELALERPQVVLLEDVAPGVGSPLVEGLRASEQALGELL